LPIAERHAKYSEEVVKRLRSSKVRAEIDERNETLEKKIRDAEIQKIPYMLVVGDKEEKNQKVAVRDRERGDRGQINLQKFIKCVKMEQR